MSFWNKNKLPAEYKDLSEDQIAELLNKGKTAELDAVTLRTQAETAETARKKAETDAADLRKRLDAKPQEREEGGEEPPQVRTGPPDSTAWLTDPNTAFNSAVAPTAAVALHGAIMSARLLADQFIRQQGPVNARLWTKFQKEVEAIVNGLSPDQRILPQTWINQFTFVKGIHLDEVVKEGQSQGDAFFSETATSTGRGMPERDASQDDVLTESEKKVAKMLGRTDAQYLASKKKMTFGPAVS